MQGKSRRGGFDGAALWAKSPWTDEDTGAMTAENENGLTYAQAGVDIDAGNALVDAIKPLVRATRGRARMRRSAASAACST